jgi:CheY-like chemotaxis protein/HPt (histidine-containing phosphotransfer) domain-containing protein
MLPFQNKHILIVEDNPSNQALTVELLHELGCKTYLAAHGKIALQQVARYPIELIFMDCHMPEMDGFAATRAIRAQEQQAQHVACPIIALTGTVLVQDKAHCLAAGMNDFLAKPIDLLTLQDTLNRWLTPCAPLLPDTTHATPSEMVTPDDVLEQSLDLVYLQKLQKDMGARGITWLIDLFLGELPRYIMELEQAAVHEDAAALYQAAHRLKGSAANIGARRLINICLELEQFSHQHAITSAARLIAVELTQERNRLKYALEKLKDV